MTWNAKTPCPPPSDWGHFTIKIKKDTLEAIEVGVVSDHHEEKISTISHHRGAGVMIHFLFVEGDKCADDTTFVHTNDLDLVFLSLLCSMYLRFPLDLYQHGSILFSLFNSLLQT